MQTVKPKGTLKVTKIGIANIPREIQRELEIENEDIAYVLDAKTAILFNPETSIEDILHSIEVLKQDILLRKIEDKPSMKIQVKDGLIFIFEDKRKKITKEDILQSIHSYGFEKTVNKMIEHFKRRYPISKISLQNALGQLLAEEMKIIR
jgi:hypothetical protein